MFLRRVSIPRKKTVMTLGSSAGVTNDAPTGNAFDIKAAPVPYFNADKKFVISQGANLALMDAYRKHMVNMFKLFGFAEDKAKLRMERVNFLLGVFAGLAVVSLDEDVRRAHLFRLGCLRPLRNVGHNLGVLFLPSEIFSKQSTTFCSMIFSMSS